MNIKVELGVQSALSDELKRYVEARVKGMRLRNSMSSRVERHIVATHLEPRDKFTTPEMIHGIVVTWLRLKGLEGHRTHFLIERDIEDTQGVLIKWRAMAKAPLKEDGEIPLVESARQAILRCYEQREEILEAFIAKYGCGPEGVMQIERKQPNGTTTWQVVRNNKGESE